MLHLQLLNAFFFAFHLVLILFNLSAWAFRPLRKWHLASMVVTAFSWFVLGIFYGWGYCFLTDWHYDVRRELGLVVDANSYIHFLLKRFSIDLWSSEITDILTGVFFGAAFMLSLYFNYADWKKGKAAATGK